MRAAIGIDIGGTNVQVALINEEGKLLQKKQLLVARISTNDSFLIELRSTIENLAQLSTVELDGIGIGSPGANIKQGIIENASNLPWERLPLVAFLKSVFQIPVYLTNDANLFAMGEKVFGRATDLNDFAVITLGTGVGAGIYCSGKLLTGRDGLSGEVGHVIAQRNGRSCLCGRKGCLERYVSASGVLLTTYEFLDDVEISSLLRDIPAQELNASYVAEAAAAGDSLAIAIFQYTGSILGRSLADMVAYFNPEAIFLAGGLSRAGDFLFLPTIKAFKENLLNIYPEEIPILPGSIPDNHAGILGAAAQVWDSIDQLNKVSPSVI